MKRAPEKIAKLREMAAAGANAAAIGRAIGVTSQCVSNWARDELIPLPTYSQAMKALHADPEFEARRAPPSPWTDKRVALLRELWTEGLSASMIADELGHGITKNSVIGKANRLHLEPRPMGHTVGVSRANLAAYDREEARYKDQESA